MGLSSNKFLNQVSNASFLEQVSLNGFLKQVSQSSKYQISQVANISREQMF